MKPDALVSRGYIARNRDVAIAYGLNAGLAAIRKRMQSRLDCPAWFLEQMDDMLHRSNCLLRPLIEHRDELAPGRDSAAERERCARACEDEATLWEHDGKGLASEARLCAARIRALGPI